LTIEINRTASEPPDTGHVPLIQNRSATGAPQKRTLWPDEPKPVLDHLEDLRRTILAIGALLALGMAVALPLAPHILHVLRTPLSGVTDRPEEFLRSLEIAGGFSIALRLTFWAGLLLAAPGIILVLARFVFPALRDVERRAAASACAIATFLFVGGVCMCYYLVMPTALRLMLGLHEWLGIRAEWTITSYVSFTVHLLLGFGLAFELPVLLLALGWLGVLTSSMLAKYRRHAIVVIFILAMVMTPPDVVSQILMAIPMILLYEMCIWLIRIRETRCARHPQIAGTDTE
jgi:sec-independent protein translocase protein TatC